MRRYTLATLFGTGLVKKGPGTAGSAVSAVIAYFILGMPFSWQLLGLGTILFTIRGTQSAHRYMQANGIDGDPKEIVVDELAGQWLTYVIGFLTLRATECAASSPCGGDFGVMFPNIFLATLLGFLLFRLFDITKPWPISWADRNIKGAWGVMFDDLLAAIPAGILLAFLYPLVMALGL